MSGNQASASSAPSASPSSTGSSTLSATATPSEAVSTDQSAQLSSDSMQAQQVSQSQMENAADSIMDSGLCDDPRYLALENGIASLASDLDRAERFEGGRRMDIQRWTDELQDAQTPWYKGGFRNDAAEVGRVLQAEKDHLAAQQLVTESLRQQLAANIKLQSEVQVLDAEAKNLEQQERQEAAKDTRQELGHLLGPVSELDFERDHISKSGNARNTGELNQYAQDSELRAAEMKQYEDNLRTIRDGLAVTGAVLATGGMGVVAGAAIGTSIGVASAGVEQYGYVNEGLKSKGQALRDFDQQSLKATVDCTFAALSTATGGYVGETVKGAIRNKVAATVLSGATASGTNSLTQAALGKSAGSDHRGFGEIAVDAGIDALSGGLTGYMLRGQEGKFGLANAGKEFVTELGIGVAADGAKAWRSGNELGLADVVNGTVNSIIGATASDIAARKEYSESTEAKAGNGPSPLQSVLETTFFQDPEASAQIDKYAGIRPDDIAHSMPIKPPRGIEASLHVPQSARALDPLNQGPNYVAPSGYRAIQFRWNEPGSNSDLSAGGGKPPSVHYQALWQTKVPGSPDGTLPSWRINRRTGGMEEVLVKTNEGGTEWVNRGTWDQASQAYVDWSMNVWDPGLKPLADQFELLERGHFPGVPGE